MSVKRMPSKPSPDTQRLTTSPSEIGHVAFRVRDLDAAEQMALNVMGLNVTHRSADELWLFHGSQHHSLHYLRGGIDAVDHIGFVAPDGDAIDEIRHRLTQSGAPVLHDGPTGPGVKDGFSFASADGVGFEIYSEMERVQPAKSGCGVRPTRFGHVSLFLRDAAVMKRQLIDLLDFRISDRVGEGAFLRYNVDHHAVGVFPGSGVLNHHAWEVPSRTELAAVADLIDQRGGSVLWGPGRHGIGRDVATYFQEPSRIGRRILRRHGAYLRRQPARTQRLGLGRSQVVQPSGAANRDVYGRTSDSVGSFLMQRTKVTLVRECAMERKRMTLEPNAIEAATRQLGATQKTSARSGER
jgi:catechol 2,3-dioxygenase